MPRSQSFMEYLLKRRVSNSSMGDFIRAARTDRFMDTVTSEYELMKYLHSKRACYSALAAAEELWRRYAQVPMMPNEGRNPYEHEMIPIYCLPPECHQSSPGLREAMKPYMRDFMNLRTLDSRARTW